MRPSVPLVRLWNARIPLFPYSLLLQKLRYLSASLDSELVVSVITRLYVLADLGRGKKLGDLGDLEEEMKVVEMNRF